MEGTTMVVHTYQDIRTRNMKPETDLSLHVRGFWDWRMRTRLLRCRNTGLDWSQRLLGEQNRHFLQKQRHSEAMNKTRKFSF